MLLMGVLFFGGALLLAAVLLALLVEAPLPEWVFPVRGRWLKYLLFGAACVALVALACLLPILVRAVNAAPLGRG